MAATVDVTAEESVSGGTLPHSLCVCVFQGHGHLRHRVRRGVSDGGGGGPVPVRLRVHEERTWRTGGRVQHLLHQHCDPELCRWVRGSSPGVSGHPLKQNMHPEILLWTGVLVPPQDSHWSKVTNLF